MFVQVIVTSSNINFNENIKRMLHVHMEIGNFSFSVKKYFMQTCVFYDNEDYGTVMQITLQNFNFLNS